jgi:hypothetical protein
MVWMLVVAVVLLVGLLIFVVRRHEALFLAAQAAWSEEEEHLHAQIGKALYTLQMYNRTINQLQDKLYQMEQDAMLDQEGCKIRN